MFLSLFENRAHEIISDKLVQFISIMLDGTENPHVGITNVVSFINKIYDKLPGDSLKSAYLLFCRAHMIGGIPFSEDEWVNMRIDGPILTHLPERLRPFVSRLARSVPYQTISDARSSDYTIKTMADALIHFKGSTQGDQPVPIPQIVNYRIQPNASLPQVVDMFKELEKVYREQMLSDAEASGLPFYPSEGNVPKHYIRASESSAEIIVSAEDNTPLSYTKNGKNYAWFTLGVDSNGSREEAEAMGHCASNESSDELLSFREIINIFIANKGTVVEYHYPMLTAAVTDEQLFELRGRGNTKPKYELHEFILDLFYRVPIESFTPNSSYRYDEQFLLSDLEENDRQELLSKRPEMVPPLDVLYGPYDKEHKKRAFDKVCAEISDHLSISIDYETSTPTYINGVSTYISIEGVLKDACSAVSRTKPKLKQALKDAMSSLSEMDFKFNSPPQLTSDTMSRVLPFIFETLKTSNVGYANANTSVVLRAIKSLDNPGANPELSRIITDTAHRMFTAEFTTVPSKLSELLTTLIQNYSPDNMTYFVEDNDALDSYVHIQVYLESAWSNYYDDDGGTPDINALLNTDDYYGDERVREYYAEKNNRRELIDIIALSSKQLEDHQEKIEDFHYLFKQYDLLDSTADRFVSHLQQILERPIYDDIIRQLESSVGKTG